MTENTSEIPSLNPKEVHVWIVPFDPASDPEKFRSILSETEKQRADRFHFIKDKIQFIFFHGVLRVLLGRYLKSDPARLIFSKNPWGKPELNRDGGAEKIFFNISHSNRLALMAFSRTGELGIDVEFLDAKREMESIAEKYFTSKEWEKLRGQRETLGDRALFQHWALKEALIKGIGKGLSISLREVEISWDAREKSATILNLGSNEVRGWALQILPEPAPDYVSALATSGEVTKTKIFEYR